MGSKKRILIIYATAGTGHKKSAFAIKEAFGEIGGNVDVDIIDSLDYTNAFYRHSYPRTYIFLVNRVPLIWGLGYYLLDNRLFYGLVSWIRHLSNWVNGRRLANYLAAENYDVIISTHFLAPDVITMEGKEKIKSYLINVMTDYRTHSFWIAKGIDMHVVGHDKTKKDLISRYGIPEERIKILGVPIDPVFLKQKDKKTLITDLGIKPNLFTVLVGSGGFGVGPILDLVKSFKDISIPMQLLVVCGKNESLRASIDSVRESMGLPVKTFGYIDNMDELMEISDLIVTKAGGMMSSEALSKGLPIIAMASIPGQEKRNFNILIQSGVALEAKDVKDAPRLVERLYKEKDLMKSMQERVEAIKKPDAAYDIARLALKYLEKNR